jgi:hypothetical protein
MYSVCISCSKNFATLPQFCLSFSPVLHSILP